jgi:Fibronectin type III domain
MKASVSTRVCLILALFAIASNTARAGSATLAWQPSPSEDVAAYHIYYGNRDYQSSVLVPGQSTAARIDDLSPGTTYYFLVTALNAAGAESQPSNEALFTVPADAASAPAGLNNISTRANVLTASAAAIAGFVVGGNENHTVLLRALGPTLTSAGVQGTLTDPVLVVHQADAQGNDRILATNDNWRDTQESDITGTGLAPANDAEAAIVLSLPPGGYTAILTGANGGTGVGLIEVYDLTSTGPLLFNVSTRAFVGTDDHVLIGGFIAGSENTRVVVRALGPSLQRFGISGALADPVLMLFDSNGNVIASNDSWTDDYPTDIQYACYTPPDSSEPAIMIDRPSGNTTAVVWGKSKGTGIALVEVFYVP